jgi:hypothetical protein
MNVGSCVDCGCTLLGEALRCAACHDRHADELAEMPLGEVANAPPSTDDDATVPRPRSGSGDAATNFLARWVLTIEMIGIVVLGFVVAARGCAP